MPSVAAGSSSTRCRLRAGQRRLHAPSKGPARASDGQQQPAAAGRRPCQCGEVLAWRGGGHDSNKVRLQGRWGRWLGGWLVRGGGEEWVKPGAAKFTLKVWVVVKWWRGAAYRGGEPHGYCAPRGCRGGRDAAWGGDWCRNSWLTLGTAMESSTSGGPEEQPANPGKPAHCGNGQGSRGAVSCKLWLRAAAHAARPPNPSARAQAQRKSQTA